MDPMNIPEQACTTFRQEFGVQQNHHGEGSSSINFNNLNVYRPAPKVLLPVVHEARYDSADVQHSPKCESGTRMRIQNLIAQWANENSGRPIFWLFGPLGTGKSTIIRTVADSFDEEKRLAAGYFFKRGEQGRNNAARLFPTIAAQLAEVIPSFESCLRKSLDGIDRGAVEKKSLAVQCKLLLSGPLECLGEDNSREASRLIVIDALDECEDLQGLPLILSLLSEVCKSIKTVRLRVLVASRSAQEIVDAFEPLQQNDQVQCLKLNALEFFADTKADIRKVLERKLAEIKRKSKIRQDPWPEANDMDRLVRLATNTEPLFIYAATLLRFIYDEGRPKNPRRQLDQWLQQCDDNKSQLDQIYEPILNRAFLDMDKEQSDQLLHFLGAILLLATPLSIESLASLLHIEADDINWWIPGLHAVLDIPGDPAIPVRLLHKSFGDFLFGAEDSEAERYRVNAAEAHNSLARNCIQRMEMSLKRDICNIQLPRKFRTEVDQQTIDTCIPADLKYACLYWVYHLKRSERPMTDDVYTFLYEHFLHWLEALSLLGRLSEGALAVTELLEILQLFPSPPTGLDDFLNDASRTISSFGSIIERVPLQTYGALLLFSPLASRVRRIFWNQRFLSIGILAGVTSNWEAHRQTLDEHRNVFTALAFSPDGQLLASASDSYAEHGTIWLWNVRTGAAQRIITVHNTNIEAIAFSYDSRLLASTSCDGTVRLWDTRTGETAAGSHFWDVRAEGVGQKPVCNHFGASAVTISPNDQLVALFSDDCNVWFWEVEQEAAQQMLGGHKSRVTAVAFSLNGQILASASEGGSILLWNSGTRTIQQMLKGHRGPVSAVAFSPNGQLLASASANTVHLSNTGSGVRQWTLIGHKSRVTAVVFSPNGQLLASVSFDRTIQLWDTETGAKRQTLKGHASGIWAVAFSADSKLVASASDDRTIRLWDIETGPALQMVESHSGFIWVVAFSPDGQLVASGSVDRTVRLWDATGAVQQTLRGHNGAVCAVAFSPGSNLVASGSFDCTIRLWDVSVGRGVTRQTLKGHSGTVFAVAFSSNGQLASGSDDCTVRLWDIETGAILQTLEGHAKRVIEVAFSTNGQLVASASADCIVRLWSTETGMVRRKLTVTGLINGLAFDPASNMRLITNQGILDLPPDSSADTTITAREDPARWRVGFGSDGEWIEKDDERVVWLPPEYRPMTSAVRDSTLAIGCWSGRVVRFSGIGE